MLSFNQLFNKSTLNIFTDASIYKEPDGYTISCPGSLCVTTCNNEVNILNEKTNYKKKDIYNASLNLKDIKF